MDGDECSANCTIERCGNGILDRAREQRNDYNTMDGDGCEADCSADHFRTEVIVRPVRPRTERARLGQAIQAIWLTSHEMAKLNALVVNTKNKRVEDDPQDDDAQHVLRHHRTSVMRS